MPDSRVPAGGSPPGRGSQRADLGPGMITQPIRIATGQKYGSAKQQEQMQASRPLRDVSATPPPGPPQPPSTAPSPPPGRAPFGGGGLDPAQVLATVSAGPSSRPAEPVTTGVGGAPLGGGFKLDVLRHIATLPFAGPEITQLVAKAYQEAANGNNAKVY